MQGIAFCRSPPLWAMAVEHALQAFAHIMGSCKDKNRHMVYNNMGDSIFTRPDQPALLERSSLPF